MAEEIKEMLHCIEMNCKHNKCFGGVKLDEKDCKLLSDYITNLQQDLEKANDIIEKDRQFNQGRLLDLAKLREENEKLKYWLNDVIFDENNTNVELPARYLRKLGYIEFDDEKKVYINKHNNSPLMQEDNKEKAFYLKDEELNEYTLQLENQNEDYKSRCKKVNKIITDFMCTEEYCSVDPVAIAENYMKIQKALIGSDENE